MPKSVVVQTIETQAHRILIKNDGILRIYSKPSQINVDDIEALYKKLVELRHNNRLFVLLDPTEENSMSPEARKYIMKHLKEHVQILAVIGRKKFVRSLFQILCSFVNIGVEMKMFETEEAAEKWLVEKLA